MMGPIQFVYRIGRASIIFAVAWLGMTVITGIVTGLLMIPALDQLAFDYGHLLSGLVGIYASVRYF